MFASHSSNVALLCLLIDIMETRCARNAVSMVPFDHPSDDLEAALLHNIVLGLNAAHHFAHLRLEFYQENTDEGIFDAEGNFIQGLNTEEKGYQPVKQFFASDTFQSVKDLDLALPPRVVEQALTVKSPGVFKDLEFLTLRAHVNNLNTSQPSKRVVNAKFPSLRRNLEFTAIKIARQNILSQDDILPPNPSPRLRHLTYWAKDTDLCVPFPNLKALRLVQDAKDAIPIQGFSGLRNNLSCAKSITELHLNAFIFCSYYSGNRIFTYNNEGASPALNETVPNLHVLVIDSIDTSTESNWMEKHLICLLKSGWIQFSPMYRGRVEFVYNHGDQEGWNQFMVYELPKGLRGWDKAMGFYDTG
ncbi:unnamed protein product [Cyclocybe aegerita]|uniref:Uncharacterized protein n=1 Tax=Cyclocybe aegerita TaxID=1973307 RepID=A0A8S0W5B5_CYCAE|nr:unnamed protein product [Cyclocybe aegerita]